MKKRNILKNLQIVLPISFMVLFSYCNTTQERKTSGTVLHTSDSIINIAVMNELKHYPEVPAHNITIQTVEGIIKLTGTVDDLLAKKKAAEIASTISGVTGVVNNLLVTDKNIPDEQLARNIQMMFYYDPIVDGNEIKVTANSGSVTLKGIVDSWSERKLAENVAAAVNGVVSVNNNINIKYQEKRPTSEIAADISGLLHYDVHVNEESIDVDVEDGIVYLSGIVGSLHEKSKAINDAWVAGVDSVNASDLVIDEDLARSKRKSIRFTQPTELEVLKAIERLFVFDSRINAEDINVKVSNGEAVLSGTVNNLRAKIAAEEDAMTVTGVTEVENQIEVDPISIDTKKTVVDNTRVALNIHPRLKLYDINVSETDGKVTLTGNVNLSAEKKEATELISVIPGVKEVENKLDVNPEVNRKIYAQDVPVITEPELEPDSIIKKNIENELWWSAFVDENNVNVKVEDGKAILSGTVENPLARHYAEENALEGGAFIVEDNLEVKRAF